MRRSARQATGGSRASPHAVRQRLRSFPHDLPVEHRTVPRVRAVASSSIHPGSKTRVSRTTYASITTTTEATAKPPVADQDRGESHVARARSDDRLEARRRSLAPRALRGARRAREDEGEPAELEGEGAPDPAARSDHGIGRPRALAPQASGRNVACVRPCAAKGQAGSTRESVGSASRVDRRGVPRGAKEHGNNRRRRSQRAATSRERIADARRRRGRAHQQVHASRPDSLCACVP